MKRNYLCRNIPVLVHCYFFLFVFSVAPIAHAASDTFLGKNVRIEFPALPAPWATFVPLQAGEKPVDPLLCLDTATLERKYDNDRTTYRLALDKESEKVRNKVEVTVLSQQKDDLYNSIAYLDRFIEALRTTKASLDMATTMSGLDLIAVPLGGDIAKEYEKPRAIQVKCVEHRKNDSRTPEVPLGVGDVVTEKTIYESVTHQQKKEIAVIKKTLASLAGKIEKKIADGKINVIFELPGLVKSAFSLFATIDKIKENMVPVTRKAFQERLSDLPPDTTSSFLFTKVAPGKNFFPPASSWPAWSESLIPDSRVKDKNDLQEGALTLGEVSLAVAMIPDKQTLAGTRLELATKILELERQRKEYELKRKEICKKINTLLDALILEKSLYGCPDLIPVSLGGVTGYTSTTGETVTIKGNGFSPRGNSVSFVSGDGVALGSLRDLSSDGESLSLVIPTEIFEKGYVSFYISVKNASDVESTPLWIRPPTIQRRSDSTPAETLFKPNQRYCGPNAVDQRIFTGVAHEQSGAPKIEVMVDPVFERDTLRGERKIGGDIPLTPVYDLVVRVIPTINEYCVEQWEKRGESEYKVEGVLPPTELPFKTSIIVGNSVTADSTIVTGILELVGKNIDGEWVYEWKARGWPSGITADQVKMEKLVGAIAGGDPVNVAVEVIKQDGTKTYEKSSIPFNNCVAIWGSGKNRITSIRGFGENTLRNFLRRVDTVVLQGFNRVDPYRIYKEQFTHFVDLNSDAHDTLSLVAFSWINNRLGLTADSVQSITSSVSSCNNPGFKIVYGIKPGMLDTNDLRVFGITTHKADFAFIALYPADDFRLSVGPDSLAPKIVLHEYSHAFADLLDEYVIKDTANTWFLPYNNCSERPSSDWNFLRKFAGTTHVGCTYKTFYLSSEKLIFRPSHSSIMNNTGEDKRFNVISCGYIVRAIKGGGYVDDYWQECMGYDTVKPTGVEALRYIFSPLLSFFDRDSSVLTAQVGGANYGLASANDVMFIDEFHPDGTITGNVYEILPDEPEEEAVPIISSITGYNPTEFNGTDKAQIVVVKGSGFSATENNVALSDADSVFLKSIKVDSEDGRTLIFGITGKFIQDEASSFFLNVTNAEGEVSAPYWMQPMIAFEDNILADPINQIFTNANHSSFVVFGGDDIDWDEFNEDNISDAPDRSEDPVSVGAISISGVPISDTNITLDWTDIPTPIDGPADIVLVDKASGNFVATIAEDVSDRVTFLDWEIPENINGGPFTIQLKSADQGTLLAKVNLLIWKDREAYQAYQDQGGEEAEAPQGAVRPLGGTPQVLFSGFRNLTELIQKFAGIILPIGGIIVALTLAWFFYNGLQLIRAGGIGEKNVTDAKKGLVWGVIVLFVMFSIWGIIFFLYNIIDPEVQTTQETGKTFFGVPQIKPVE